MRYRLATSDDAETLAQMRWEFRLEEAPGDTVHNKADFLHACTMFIRQAIEGGAWHFWVAEDESMLVAHICVLTIVKIPKPNRLHDAFGYVTNVYTRPAYRNQGIGSELMRHVVEWARAMEMENLMVWPSERSIPFYARAGFVADEEAMDLILRAYVL
jgi:GNAT superfamily N-acetyltransferase